MPVMSCNENNRPGYKYGASGKCYTYNTGDKKGAARAKLNAYKQGIAITGGTMKEKDSTESEVESMDDLELGLETFLMESKLR